MVRAHAGDENLMSLISKCYGGLAALPKCGWNKSELHTGSYQMLLVLSTRVLYKESQLLLVLLFLCYLSICGNGYDC